jgi:hypothetical protein
MYVGGYAFANLSLVRIIVRFGGWIASPDVVFGSRIYRGLIYVIWGHLEVVHS